MGHDCDILVMMKVLVAVFAFAALFMVTTADESHSYSLAAGGSVTHTISLDNQGYNFYVTASTQDGFDGSLSLAVAKQGEVDGAPDTVAPYAKNIDACPKNGVQAGTYDVTVTNTGSATATGEITLAVESAHLVEKNDLKADVSIAPGVWKYYRMVVTSNKNDTHWKATVVGKASQLAGIYVRRDNCPTTYCPAEDDPLGESACNFDARGDISDGDDPYVESIATPQGVYWIGIRAGGGANQAYDLRVTGAASALVTSALTISLCVLLALAGSFM